MAGLTSSAKKQQQPNIPFRYPTIEENVLHLSDSIADSMKHMEILGTPNNGVKGGRFGYGRGLGTLHGGLDLNGNIGDTIFSTLSGNVIATRNYFDPKVDYKDYKSDMDRRLVKVDERLETLYI